MRFLTLPLVLLLPAVAVAQARQFQADGNRTPNLYLPGGSRALACGDVDGDGDLDCLVAQRSTYPSPSLVNVVLFRRQSGAWQQTLLGSVAAATGIPRLAITLADLDGDADLDAVIVVSGELATASTRIVCFRNDGAGSFAIMATTQLPGVADAELVVGDVDGDLDRDLIVGLKDAAGLPLSTILVRHDGAFGFQVEANALPSTPAAAPELADIDADGDLDVLAIDATGRVISFLDQGGTYATGGVLAAGVARYIVAADFDGDGDTDMVVQEPAGGTVLLRHTPSGFLPQPIAQGGASAGLRPVLADINGDHAIDVVVQVDGELRVLRNDGLANFYAEPVAASAAFAAGDVDQDGVPDLLFDVNDSGLAVALGRPDRMLFDQALARAPFSALANAGFTECTGDFDGDGRADILQQDEGRLLVRRSRGAGEWSTVVLPVPFLRSTARALDVDGDGDEDIVAVNGDSPGGLQVFRNDGGFAFTALAMQTLPSAWIAGTGDFNGDHRVDMLIGTGQGTIQTMLSLGGAFAPPTTVFSGTNGWSEPGIWDFDGDRDLDLLIAPQNGSCIQLLTNDGSGSFTVTNPCVVPAPPGWGFFFDYKVLDIDGDGDPDVFTWAYGSGRLMINNGGSFTTTTINGVFASALLMPWFADWDGDGDIDLLQLGGPAQLFLNSGNGTLVDATATRLGWLEFSGAAVADVDGDDDPDIIGPFGMLATQPLNQLRSVASLSRPSLGGQLRLRLGHEPGFATASSLGMPILATRLRASPLRVPGIAGTLQVDAATAVVLPLLTLPAPAGIAEAVVNIPLLPSLVGLDVYAQGLLLGPSPAFTATVHERALP